MNILSYSTRGNQPDIFAVADQLENKGWTVDRQQFPTCIHLTVLPTNLPAIDRYADDLEVALAFAKANPSASGEGNAALYGLMARIPLRGLVEKNVRKIFVEMYGGGAGEAEDSPEIGAVAQSPHWMGWVSRLLAHWRK
jgi:hypothetical protein